MRGSRGGGVARAGAIGILLPLALRMAACAPSSDAPDIPTPESERLLGEAAAADSAGHAAEALALCETVLRAQPDLTAARVRAADLSRRTGDPEAAVLHARRALKHPPESPADLAALARALAPDDPDRARSLLAPWLDADTTRADVQLAAADVALSGSDPSTAMRHLRRALAAGPSPSQKLEIARGFARAGFPSDAVETVREAIASGDDSPETRYTLGWTLERAERYDECVHEYFSLLEDHPDYLPAYLNLGALMARDGELERAVALWERGLAHHPGNEDLQANIDQALDALGVMRKEGSE